MIKGFLEIFLKLFINLKNVFWGKMMLFAPKNSNKVTQKKMFSKCVTKWVSAFKKLNAIFRKSR